MANCLAFVLSLLLNWYSSPAVEENPPSYDAIGAVDNLPVSYGVVVSADTRDPAQVDSFTGELIRFLHQEERGERRSGVETADQSTCTTARLLLVSRLLCCLLSSKGGQGGNLGLLLSGVY